MSLSKKRSWGGDTDSYSGSSSDEGSQDPYQMDEEKTMPYETIAPKAPKEAPEVVAPKKVPEQSTGPRLKRARLLNEVIREVADGSNSTSAVIPSNTPQTQQDTGKPAN